MLGSGRSPNMSVNSLQAINRQSVQYCWHRLHQTSTDCTRSPHDTLHATVMANVSMGKQSASPDETMPVN